MWKVESSGIKNIVPINSQIITVQICGFVEFILQLEGSLTAKSLQSPALSDP